VAIPTTYITLPRFGAFTDIVDMVMTTDNQIDSMCVLYSLFISDSAQLVR
jgi:hypothetical protein